MTSVIPLNTDRRRENENRRSSDRLDCGGGARLSSGGDVHGRREHFGWSWKKKNRKMTRTQAIKHRKTARHLDKREKGLKSLAMKRRRVMPL